MSRLFFCTKSLLQRLALLCGFSSTCYCGHRVATCEVWPERAREQANDCTNEWSHAQCGLEESFECFVIIKVEVNNSAFSITPCNSVMVKKKFAPFLALQWKMTCHCPVPMSSSLRVMQMSDLFSLKRTNNAHKHGINVVCGNIRFGQAFKKKISPPRHRSWEVFAQGTPLCSQKAFLKHSDYSTWRAMHLEGHLAEFRKSFKARGEGDCVFGMTEPSPLLFTLLPLHLLARAHFLYASCVAMQTECSSSI